ncbi:MAG: hypothetical protein GQ535_12345 [Rhodobacteraceae bacterium]|nr:hypothetical protein [Paracoccaceae bacterium]
MLAKLILLLLSLSVFAVSASAQSDRATLIALQTKLYDLGYYQGEIDGLTGPATSRALAGYSTENGGSNTVAGVITTIIAQQPTTLKGIVTDAMKAAVRERFNEVLSDGESAKYIFDFSYPAAQFEPTSEIAVCGRVNGKNQYGAYVGYTPFLVILSPTSWESGETYYVMHGDPTQDSSELECLLATSAIAGIIER